MKIETSSDESSSAIDLTPLIDVVFLLLVFFMVTTTFLNQEKVMEIDLPKTESGSAQDSDVDEYIINVFNDGRLTLGGVDVDRVSLGRSLKGAKESGRIIPVTIRADTNVVTGKVVEVMDVCQQAGFLELSIATMALHGALHGSPKGSLTGDVSSK